jgi:hypothetical protein
MNVLFWTVFKNYKYIFVYKTGYKALLTLTGRAQNENASI